MRSFFNRLFRIAVTIILVVSAILTTALLFLDDNLRVVLNSYSSSAASVRVNTLLNGEVFEYIDEYGVEYSDIVKIIYGTDSEIKSLQIDTVKVNKIKSGIVLKAQEVISNNSDFVLSLPVGTIIGSEFTLNRGPTIDFDMKMSSAVHSELISYFEEAGINQTLHRIVLNIKTDIYIVLPWYRTNSTHTTNFTIAETVIVGKVPDAFTMVIESTDDLTAGYINDYGANNFID